MEDVLMKPIVTGVMSTVLVALTATGALAQTAYDDQVCRQYAGQNAANAQAQANNQAAGSAIGGALLGAGVGAAIGGGRGAAIGAGAGAITGAGAGAANAQGAGDQAYWSYYNQCMASRRPAPPPPAYGAPPPSYGQPYGQPSTQQLNQQQLNQGPQYYNYQR
jgi:hypothetical protein